MPSHTDAKNTLKRKKTPPKPEDDKDAKTKITRKALHTCTYCGRDISKLYRIKCAECSGFSLCLPCFSVGAELHPHKNSHKYYIHGNLGFPLYDLSWTADEEMLLLEAIDISGLGNWSAVASHIGSKTANECKSHYFEIYIRSPLFPLPQMKKEMEGVDPLKVLLDRQVKTDYDKSEDIAREITKQDISQGALRPPGTADEAQVDPGPPEIDETSQQAISEIQPATTGQGLESRASGLAKRVRTEKNPSEGGSHQGPAQQQLSSRGLPPARTQPDPNIAQITPLPGVNQKLPESPKVSSNKIQKAGHDPTGYHIKRQEFDHEYDNDAEMLISEISFNPGDTPDETEEKLKLVEVYNQRLIERERRREDVVKQELFHQKRHQEKKHSQGVDKLSNQLRIFSRYTTQQNFEALVEGIFLEEKMRVRLQELNQMRRHGVRNFEEAETFEAEQRKKSSDKDKAGISFGYGESGGKAPSTNRVHPSASATQISTGSGTPSFTGNAASQLSAWRTRRGIHLDITGLPGAQYLSAKERMLCVNDRLLPSQYLAYKASFLREAERNEGKMTRSEAKYMFRLKAATILKVFDFMVSCGWISTGSPSSGGALLEESGASPAHSKSEKI